MCNALRSPKWSRTEIIIQLDVWGWVVAGRQSIQRCACQIKTNIVKAVLGDRNVRD